MKSALATDHAPRAWSPVPPAGDAAILLQLVAVPCPVCGADDAVPVGVGEDFEYRTSDDAFLAERCRRCGVVYLNPRPAIGELDRIYPPDYHAYEFSAKRFGLAYRVRRRLERWRLRRWSRHLPPAARILDIGCGDGFHLRLLREIGPATWELEGVDTSPAAAAAARAAGLTVHRGTLEDVPLASGAYDLVLMLAIIEHVDDPRAMLGRVGDLLAPGGRAVVVTDNVDTPAFALAGARHWGGYHFPRHWQLFTRASLAALARSAGLDVERVATMVTPVNWVYTIHNFLADSGASTSIRRHVSLGAAPALALFTVVNAVECAAGRGGLVEAVLRRRETRAGEGDHETPDRTT